jgi:iron complex outermembrane receptor protein
MKFQQKLMPLAIVQVLAGTALSATAPGAAAQSGAAEPQRVVVTGSMVSRASRETPSPLQIITNDELVKSGYTTVQEVLANITANGQGSLSSSFAGAFANGGSGVSLRGLTVGLTLVLIDGHRMAPYPLADDGQRPFVDVSAIPFDAVERVEVLKDGASSVYGSDAIAGVVNIILKKAYKGTTVKAEAGTSQHGGGATYHAALTTGIGDLATDGYNAFISLEARKAERIRLSQRDDQLWANGDWTSRGGVDLRRGVPSTVNAGRTAASVPFFYDQTGAGGATNPANFSFIGPSCNFSLYSAGGCAIRDVNSNIQPETKRANVLAGFTTTLGPDWKLVVKGSLFKRESINNRGLSASFPAGSFAGNTALGPNDPPHTVGVIPSFLLPASYPGNPYGKAVRIYGIIPDVPPTTSTDATSTSTRLVADLSGTLGEWEISAALGHTKVKSNIDYSGYIDRVALYNALTRPVNPFKIGGGNTAADIAAVAPRFSNVTVQSLDFAELRAGRELMTLAGGPLAMSAGVSYMHKKLDAPPPSLLSLGVVGNAAAYAFGEEKNTAAFVEFVAPVLTGLEVDLSGRFDHYDTFGNSSTPKLGFKWAPSSMATLRGTYSKGFRAPNAAENGVAGSTAVFKSINDPILCKDGNPATAGNVVAACNFQPQFVQVTTKDLQPEKSTSATLGVILEPVRGWATTIDYYKIKVNGQVTTASALPDFVPTYVRGAPLATAIADGRGGTVIAVPPVGQISYATTGYVNAGSTETRGVEIDTSYAFQLADVGRIKAGLQLTHTISYLLTQLGQTYELAGTHGPSAVSGNTGNPKNRAQGRLGLDRGALNLTATVNWIGSFKGTDPSLGLTRCDDVLSVSGRNYFFGKTMPEQYCTIESFMTTDLSATYKMGNWTLHGAIQNLFDKAPPMDVATYGNPGSGLTSYNPALHQSGAVGRYFNLGASYKF